MGVVLGCGTKTQSPASAGAAGLQDTAISLKFPPPHFLFAGLCRLFRCGAFEWQQELH